MRMPKISSRLLITAALFAVMAAPAARAQLKYVAVVETELDASSGAADDLSSAEVRQITAELRREAVANLPRGKYNIMTTETVYAQGGAVLEECAEENCVITLGSKIGADYIVRGHLSKFKTKLTLSVEIYETEDGTLVASSDPIRSENAAELLEKAGPVCADMFKKFADARAAAQKPPALEQPPAEPAPAPEQTVKPQIAAPAPAAPKTKRSFWTGLAADIAGAGLLAYGAYQENNVKNYVNDKYYNDRAEYDNAKKSASNRNIGYIIGGAFLVTGISFHIFF